MQQASRAALYITNSCGGVETTIAQLVPRLRDRGWHILVLAEMTRGARWSAHFRRSGISVVEVECPDRDPQREAAPLVEALVRHDIDVFVPSYEHAPHLAMTSAARDHGIAGVMTFTGSHDDYLDTFVPYAQHAHVCIAVSRYVEASLRTRGLHSDMPLRWIPPAASLVDGEPAIRTHPAVRLVYAGRLDEEHKRVSRYLALCSRLRQAGADCTLTLIGEGPARPSLELTAESDPFLTSAVHFAGLKWPWEVAPAIAEHDIALLLSDSEGLSVAMLEAMGAGLPVVVSNVRSGVGDVIRHGVNGIVVDADDERGLDRHILQLAADPAQRRTIGANARRTVAASFSPDVMAARYSDALHLAVRRAQP